MIEVQILVFLIPVVGVYLHRYPCPTHNHGRLLFERPAKAKKKHAVVGVFFTDHMNR